MGEPAVAVFLEPFFSFLPEKTAIISAHSVAVAIGFIVVTFVHVVIGELVPKAIALQRTEKTALMTVTPLITFISICNPFIWLLDRTNAILLKALGLSPVHEGESLHSEDEVKMILSQSGQGGMIPQDEVAMANNVFKMGDTSIDKIMLPRTDIIAFNQMTPMPEVLDVIMHSPHSRFPVYKDSLDNIIGYVHIKDVYRTMNAKKTPKFLKDITEIREIITVPGNKLANDVLLDMQRLRKHMAVVADEFGGTEGIVTLEDIIESLVGEIYDEFEKPQKPVRKIGDNTYIVDGRAPIGEIQKEFNLPIRGYGYTTIGGLVFGLLGREGIVGDKVQIGQSFFEVTKIQGSRIVQLKIKTVK